MSLGEEGFYFTYSPSLAKTLAETHTNSCLKQFFKQSLKKKPCLMNIFFKYNAYCIYHIASGGNLTQETVFLNTLCPLLWMIGLCSLSHRNTDLVKVDYIHDPSNPPSFFWVTGARCYGAWHSNLMLDKCSMVWHHADLFLTLNESFFLANINLA